MNLEIRTDPYNLQINDDSIVYCPCCNNVLVKQVNKGNYLIDGDCGYCRYLDRPFGGCGNTAATHFGGCSCEYGEKDYLYISCENCKSPKCLKCQTSISCRNQKCGSIVCDTCIKRAQFNDTWKTTTPQEKLDLYGIVKLKILAKNKNVKGYSKYTKRELINTLSPLVNENDFPINTR